MKEITPGFPLSHQMQQDVRGSGGSGRLCFNKITISDIAEFEDGATGSAAYIVRKGPKRKVAERLKITITNHPTGEQKTAKVKIAHTISGNPSKGTSDYPGWFDGAEYDMAPNTHISNLPPTGRGSHRVTHGEFVRGQQAWRRDK